MNNRMNSLPIAVRKKIELLGNVGQEWLTKLSVVIAELERKWQITTFACLEGGSEAYVAPAVMIDGTEVILKIAIPEMEGNTVFNNEVTALTIANGHGYARIVQFDLGRRALLLERMGAPLKDSPYSSVDQIKMICGALKISWLQKIGHGTLLQTGEEAAGWFAAFIPQLWVMLDRPCSDNALEKAIAFAISRSAAHSAETSVLVHGDAHNGNLLETSATNHDNKALYKLIDPDGLFAEPAYDLGVLMREWVDELFVDPLQIGKARAEYLSSLSGTAPQAIWEWGFLQCLATGLLLLQTGQLGAGRQLIQVAEAWAAD